MGDAWANEDWVFTTSLGTPIEPGNLHREFRRIIERAKVKRIRFHDLRDTHVSLLGLAGMDAKVIAERIGHSNVAFTQQVYQHLFQAQRKKAALAERYSLRSVKMVRQRLWQVFRDALDMELVFRNPVDPVRIKAPRGQARSKAGRALEPHEVTALLAALDAHKDRRTALALRLMLACGLRRGEALGLIGAGL